ncbi:MAG TPA: NAD(P)-dependent oxidoreductase [Acidimicrobiales bacterium]|nr:NAD(P)-dependent oxidoreductase [Acidimicrobiales bacterium]
MAQQGARYTEEDADLSALEGQRVAVVGYGNLGRPAALNLRDAGLAVVVGSREEPAASRARTEGFEVVPIEEAVGGADVVWLALPDEVIPEVLAPTAATRPAPGALVCFSSGYTLAYDLVKLPSDVDAVLLAPRMIGARIRELYVAGQGFYSFVSVEQDATGTARARLLALAKGFGTLRRAALEVCARDEAALDLFVEQTLGPYLGAAVLAAFEVGVGRGLPPDALALELYLSGEMASTWEAFAEHGFFEGVRLHGHSASFGGFIRLSNIDVEAMKRSFGDILDDITSGGFAHRFQEELAAGSPTRELIEAMVSGDDPLSRAEAALRDARSG